MSSKVDQVAIVETHHVQSAATTSSSTSSATSTKISMFKGKAGFVIPKNKFSGSLVPIFKGVKKSEANDAASEESSKQVQRKTKWGPDLTQDTAVRRGRALAYQTRVDQITEQLKLGSLGGQSQKSESAGGVTNSELPTVRIEYEKLQNLELERREAIGEILKLNPSYKAPSDYQPVLREARVPIAVKENPGFDFLGLVYGSDGETQKRLEKDTGTRIQICGTKSGTREKVEFTTSDGIDVLRSCDEVYVRILADTYKKVDAAAALVELLFSSVLGKSATSRASTSISGDSVQVLSEGLDMATAPAVNAAAASQELVQPIIVPSSQGFFQPYPGSWFVEGRSITLSGRAPVPSSVAFPFSPSPTHTLFGPRPTAPYGFGSSPQSIPVVPPRLHPPDQVMQRPFVPPAYPSGQAGPPRNVYATTSQSPLLGRQPTAAGLAAVQAPPPAERPLTPVMSSLGWAAPPIGTSQSLASGCSVPPPIGSSQGSMVPQAVGSSPARPFAPSVTPPLASPQGGPVSTSFVAPHIRSSSAMQVQSFAPQAPSLPNSSSNTALRPAQLPQSGTPSPALGTLNAPSFTPLRPMGGAAPRPAVRGPGDITFQPHRPHGLASQSVPGPGVHFASQRPQPTQLSPGPQVPSFRPALQNMVQQPVRPNFPRPQIDNLMGPPHPGQFRPPSSNPQMGPRNLGPVPQMLNSAGPFPPRVGHSGQYQQSFPTPQLGRPGGLFAPNQHSIPSGRPQTYDPFSQGSSNLGTTRKQESDPEYEDLMASVGVK